MIPNEDFYELEKAKLEYLRLISQALAKIAVDLSVLADCVSEDCIQVDTGVYPDDGRKQL